jgi:hypothetical protein
MPGHTGERSCSQKLLCFHVLSWTISRSPAWAAASDKERKSQSFTPTEPSVPFVKQGLAIDTGYSLLLPLSRSDSELLDYT